MPSYLVELVPIGEGLGALSVAVLVTALVFGGPWPWVRRWLKRAALGWGGAMGIGGLSHWLTTMPAPSWRWSPAQAHPNLNEKVTVDEVKAEAFRDQANRPITLSRAHDYDLVALNIPMEYASLELIDGQHRLYGFVDADPETRSAFNLVVLGVKGLDIAQRRDAFIAINDSPNLRSKRVGPKTILFRKWLLLIQVIPSTSRLRPRVPRGRCVRRLPRQGV